MLGCTSIYFVGFKTMWMLQMMLNVSTFCWPRWRHSTWHYRDSLGVLQRNLTSVTSKQGLPLSHGNTVLEIFYDGVWMWDLSLTSKEGQLNVCQVYFIFFNSEKFSPILLPILVCSAWTQWESGTWRVKLHHKDVSTAQLQLVVLRLPKTHIACTDAVNRMQKL